MSDSEEDIDTDEEDTDKTEESENDSSDDDEEDNDEEEDSDDDDDDDDDSDDDESNDDSEDDDDDQEEDEDEKSTERSSKKSKKDENESDKPSVSSVLAQAGTTITGTGIKINDIKNTIVEIVEVGGSPTTSGSTEAGESTFMHVRIRAASAPQHAVDIKIDEKHGCSITLASASESTASQTTYSSPSSFSSSPSSSPTFTRPAGPPPFQFDRSRGLSAQMAELLHTQLPQMPQPLRYPGYFSG
ncbi:uncharacterized protein MONOS_3717 [Monocercomonoides exilis]|uniref:uncharacterized protein n=1 Tax=Monocercomonoides exilis TaxID=2049356 RepID=UPI003559E86D|nr:hypothetical protein MONOS_3717 [Monocercomonoides exilis]|eukprot:MONOS_3717.1-p1 / transcript=MONOS_3717.1 / gene=MONOS_3717 / organism=Monocercomonoides_exilis_PA203 / gene_product=unspecified product / transcript_product=unspecified product / location=Mono_scaffold00090:73037-73768(-) / protein_length=244 / sequence_SO=supercontig / SO=protein_coding / is_pseudo=false